MVLDEEVRPLFARSRQLPDRYLGVRQASEAFCEPLAPEDCVIQSMPDTSPIRWHLAHATWFFETFVLARANPDYRPFNPAFEILFNSYYHTVGEQFPRPQRGLLSRPTMADVFEYRQEVDRRMVRLLTEGESLPPELLPVVELGLHHEQQHQELMYTDVKHLFACNPLNPAYRGSDGVPDGATAPPLTWLHFREGLREIGHDGDGFAFDNENPRHRRFVEAFHLAGRPATNGEFLEFIDDGGYRRPELWLSLGWQTVQSEVWHAPIYWRRGDNGGWSEFTLSGLKPLNLEAPVCHLSYFEADAFARWSGARLPSEAEWEVAAQRVLAEDGEIRGNFAESGRLHPAPAQSSASNAPAQMFGDVWEWTSSPYSPYSGYRPPDGALGEYNGKFMCNQYVLRGGSCVTPESHIRETYRNFFPPEARWQLTGVRLARDA
ncbi:MAG: ergothioneine biosynthesis protein EgtB [Planctomycetes bacterium]|nr:ergothioneine biosynthesis protein EgtB [Planctomycetota bacterium]